MKFFDWLFRKKIREDELLEDDFDEAMLEERTLDRDDVDMDDPYQRQKFVESCLEQMKEASDAMERLEKEYESVDAYLKDLEEVEMLAGADRRLLNEHAKGIKTLSQDTSKYEVKKHRLLETDFRKMQRLEGQAAEGLKKIREAEEYQEAVRADLKRLEGEKHACMYRQSEASIGLNNYRGMAVILVSAVFISVALLLFLQFGLLMDATIGYVLVMLAAGIALVTLYVKFMETKRELKRASTSLNKIILLQNKVKIRYINNTNLLDYLYVKYEVPSAEALEKMWKQYLAEKDERVKMEQVMSDLEFHQNELVKLLKRYRLFDPIIWIHQADAILDSKEMVEVRHNLIVRRQRLRKQMEYNKELAVNAQEEIKQIVNEYTKYAAEVMEIVEKYEKNS